MAQDQDQEEQLLREARERQDLILLQQLAAEAAARRAAIDPASTPREWNQTLAGVQPAASASAPAHRRQHKAPASSATAPRPMATNPEQMPQQLKDAVLNSDREEQDRFRRMAGFDVSESPAPEKKGFWNEFTRGLRSPLKLWMEESIPAQFMAGEKRKTQEDVNRALGMHGTPIDKLPEAAPDKIDWETIAEAVDKHPGQVLASVVNAIIADPELLLLAPEVGAASKAAEALGGASRVGRAIARTSTTGAAGADVGAASEAAQQHATGEQSVPKAVRTVAAGELLGALLGLRARDLIPKGPYSAPMLDQLVESGAGSRIDFSWGWSEHSGRGGMASNKGLLELLAQGGITASDADLRAALEILPKLEQRMQDIPAAAGKPQVTGAGGTGAGQLPTIVIPRDLRR